MDDVMPTTAFVDSSNRFNLVAILRAIFTILLLVSDSSLSHMLQEFVAPSNLDFSRPQPVLYLHKGYISLADRILAVSQFSGPIIPGNPYTLDIQMGRTDKFDYIIEKCAYDTQVPFIDNNGCPYNEGVQVKNWLTNVYAAKAQSAKRTIIHLTVNRPIERFECHLKVIECRGCAEQTCDRRPFVGLEAQQYSSYVVPLTCCCFSPPIASASALIPLPRPYSYWGNNDYSRGPLDFIPPWLLFLLLAFLILLLILLCCLACFFLGRFCNRQRRRGQGSKVWMSDKTSAGGKEQTQMRAQQSPKIYVSESSQTNNRIQTNSEISSRQFRQEEEESKNGRFFKKNNSFEDDKIAESPLPWQSESTRFSVNRPSAERRFARRPPTPRGYAMRKEESWKEEEDLQEFRRDMTGETSISQRVIHPRPSSRSLRVDDALWKGYGFQAPDDTNKPKRFPSPVLQESEDFWKYHETDGENVKEEIFRRIHQTTTSLV